MSTVAEFDHDLNALFGGQLYVAKRIGFIRFLVAMKGSDRFLHGHIISAHDQVLESC